MDLSSFVRSTIEDRITAGTSQADLAKAVGVAPITLSRYRRKQRDLTVETASKILAAMGVDFGRKKKSRKLSHNQLTTDNR